MLTLGCHLFVDGFELLAKERNSLTDDSFIRLNLGLTHTTVRTAPSSLTIKVTPHPRQSRQHILQMRHLDLRLRVTRLRALKENL